MSGDDRVLNKGFSAQSQFPAAHGYIYRLILSIKSGYQDSDLFLSLSKFFLVHAFECKY